MQKCCIACKIGLDFQESTGECSLDMRYVDDRTKNITSKCCRKDFENFADYSEYFEDNQISVLPQQLETEPVVFLLDGSDKYGTIDPSSIYNVVEAEAKSPLSCSTYDICEENQQCIDTTDGYVCTCKPGYETQSSGDCNDINECEKGLSNCSSHKNCVNTEGSFKCEGCVSGYEKLVTYNYQDEYDDYQYTCTDIDECQRSYCGKTEICTNMPGSFRCTKFVCPGDYKFHNKS